MAAISRDASYAQLLANDQLTYLLAAKLVLSEAVAILETNRFALAANLFVRYQWRRTRQFSQSGRSASSADDWHDSFMTNEATRVAPRLVNI